MRTTKERKIRKNVIYFTPRNVSLHGLDFLQDLEYDYDLKWAYVWKWVAATATLLDAHTRIEGSRLEVRNARVIYRTLFFVFIFWNFISVSYLLLTSSDIVLRGSWGSEMSISKNSIFQTLQNHVEWKVDRKFFPGPI